MSEENDVTVRGRLWSADMFLQESPMWMSDDVCVWSFKDNTAVLQQEASLQARLTRGSDSSVIYVIYKMLDNNKNNV